jgi:hypothetical protein
MTGFRKALEREVSPQFRSILGKYRRPKGWLLKLWLIIYVVTFFIGIVMVRLGDPPPKICEVRGKIPEYLETKIMGCLPGAAEK